MVNLKIDHNEISVPEGTTIMEAAALAMDLPPITAAGLRNRSGHFPPPVWRL